MTFFLFDFLCFNAYNYFQERSDFMELSEAISKAKSVRKYAYAPYSKYYVGCALKTKSGKFYTGCNIENSGIQSICAERVAFSKAISEGEKDFEYIVICGGSSFENTDDNCTPCGYCRQFISEFVDDKFRIYTLNGNNISSYSIKDLLPNSFKL